MSVSGFKENFGVKDAGAIGVMFFVNLCVQEVYDLGADSKGNFNAWDNGVEKVLEVLLHGTLVVGVSQTFRRSTEGATYIRQGGHHVGHWPTFLVASNFANC